MSIFRYKSMLCFLILVDFCNSARLRVPLQSGNWAQKVSSFFPDQDDCGLRTLVGHHDNYIIYAKCSRQSRNWVYPVSQSGRLDFRRISWFSNCFGVYAFMFKFLEISYGTQSVDINATFWLFHFYRLLSVLKKGIVDVPFCFSVSAVSYHFGFCYFFGSCNLPISFVNLSI